MKTKSAIEAVPKVVIIGGGFGGLLAARELGNAPIDLTVIDRSNHHLFQPLLYQVATAGLSPAHIAAPIRAILRHQSNTEVVMAEVTGVDKTDRQVITTHGNFRFDYLVIATGARHGYFNRPDWEAFAPGLKAIPDATNIRQRVLLAFESAETELDPVKRANLLNFVIVGGGPTGVELAGAISELAHRALDRDFRNIDTRSARIILLEAGPRILTSFSESLSKKAQKELAYKGVEVRTNSKVENITADGVYLGNEMIPSQTVIWAAGVIASRAGKWLGAESDRVGRVKVLPDLSVPNHPNIFVIGDTATLNDSKNRPLPGVAPVAMQQGSYVGKSILKRVRGKTKIAPFRYHDKGNLATVGRSFAVAEVGKIKLHGLIAWVGWLAIHIYYLIGYRNRLVVLMEWTWAYSTFQRGARIITGTERELAHVTE